MTKNIEQIAGLRPEILLQDLFHVSDKDDELIATGSNTVLYNEWKERELLGRAECLYLPFLYAIADVSIANVFQVDATHQFVCLIE